MTGKVFYLFFNCFFSWLLNTDKAKRIAFESLIQPHTYRIKEDKQRDYFSVLSYLKRSLSRLFEKEMFQLVNEGNGRKAMFRNSSKAFRHGFDYLKAVTSDPPGFHISRDSLGIANSRLFKVWIAICIFVTALPLFPVSIFAKRKGTIGLILLELTECCLLLKHLKLRNIEYLYFFESFEKDSNFISVVLQKYHIKVHRIPSANPLVFYKKVVSDIFSFTVDYQKMEYENLKDNWIVDQIVKWPIPGYQELGKYLNRTGEEYQYDLGFISRGIWLRKERGDSFLGIGEMESEEMLITYLKEFLEKNEETTFTVFLHPIEKASGEIFRKSQNYYLSIFGNRTHFFENSHPSKYFFNKVNTAVSAYSSTVVERLFCGYKSLLFPFAIKNFPVAGSSLSNICARSRDELFCKVGETLKISEVEFFEKNKIKEYRFSEWNVK